MRLIVKKILKSEDFAEYLKHVESFDEINPFYKILGATLHGESDYHNLRYFVFVNDNGNILVLMPFILRKVPCIDIQNIYYDVISPYGYSGPLYNESMSRGYLIKFWEAVDLWYKKNNIISEFIRFSLNHNTLFYSGTLIPTLANVRGVIIDKESQWNNFKQKVRNNYRKSLSHNLKIKVKFNDITQKDIKCFYNIYISTMKRVKASQDYFYSLNYFINVEKLSRGKIMFAFVLNNKGEAISSELLLVSGETFYSYLGGTLVDYFNLRPNDFLKIEMMKWAKSNGFKYYILGGGREDNDSLYKYKKSFFPNDPDVVYYTGRKIINNVVYEKLDKIMNTNVIVDDDVTFKNIIKKNTFFPSYRKNAFSKN